MIPNIIIDGQPVKCKKNEFGSFEVDYQTDKEEVELDISRELELKAKLWWLYALISFFVSLFGIFEPFYDRKCITLDCLYKIKLKDINEIKVKFNTLSSQGRAVEIETENQYEELKNEYHVDKIAKRRWIALLVIKIIIWIGLGILVGYFISKI